METVSIVIPCRNEKNYIGKCIDSFLNQSYPKDCYEVLICDGMSTDGTRKIVHEYESKYDNIKLLDNLGLTAPKAMNLGIKKSTSDVVVIFGAHAFADKDFIKYNVEALRKEGVQCAGGPIETINDSDKGRAISLAMSSPFGVGNALFRYAKEETYVDTVPFGAYKRATVEKLGYFDEELVRNQDDEINLRVIKDGGKILLSPKIKSWYYSRSSLTKLWNQYKQYGFWKVRVIQKHKKPASIRHLIPITFVISLIVSVLGSLFFSFFRYLLALILIPYIILDVIFTLKLCDKKIRYISYLLIIFPILHLSYGWGFLLGTFNFYVFKSKNMVDKNTKMSR